MLDPLDAELAMSILQLTAVLLPLMLGITRYYVTQGDNVSDISISSVLEYISFMSTLLFIACLGSLIMFFEYGNMYIYVSIVSYVFFFIGLLVAIPVVVTDSFDRGSGWPILKGVVAAFSAVFFFVLLIVFSRSYI